MRPLLLLALLLSGFTGHTALAAFVPEKLSAFDFEALAKLDGKKITKIDFSAAASAPESVKARIAGLQGKTFHPPMLRQLLDWFHENQGDTRLAVGVSPEAGGVKLSVEYKEKKKISAVLFQGNKILSSAVLGTISDMKEEADYDALSAEASAKKIVTYYNTLGYLNAEARAAFNEKNELIFSIQEGDPTLIVDVGVSPLTSIENKKLRTRYESEIRELFGLRPGDKIERARALQGLQNIKEWLKDHDFLTAKDPILDYKVTEENRVAVYVNIQYGSRIRFGFRGNSHFSYRELMGFVSEVKEVSSGADYLDAVRRRIIDAYKDSGLVNVSINTLVREDIEKGIKFVSIIIDEGQKVRISSLKIDGIYSMSEGDAKDKFNEFANRLVQRHYFHEGGINKAAELLAEYLKSNGYLSARLEFAKFDFTPDRKKVAVTLLFSEGVQTIVQDIAIKGLKSFSEKEVLELLGLEKEKPFNIFKFEKGLVLLKEKYQDIGNLNAQILNEGTENIVKYSRDASAVSIDLEIEEGPVFRVGDIIVRGNQQTHTRVILRELPFISGDVLTRPLLTEAEDNIRKLNLFGSVILRPIDRPGEEDKKDILILVEETVPGSIEIAPGYRNDLGLRLSIGASYANLGGWHRSVSARAVFNRRVENYHFPEYNISFGFREPYLAEWPVVFTSNLNLLRRQFTSFDAYVARITSAVKRDLTKYFSVFLEYGYERVEIKNAKSPYTRDDEKTSFIGSMTPGFVFDSRNDRFNPSKGLISTNRFEVASNAFGSQTSIGYYKTSTNNSVYFPLWSDVVFAAAVNFGWERSNISGKEIPLLKLFRLGGIGSIRGYDDDSIEVETKKTINGTLGLVNYRGEFRLPLSGSFGTAVFADAGNLMIDRFAPFELRSSVGAGLRYNTPVGPVVLDVAWKLQNSAKVGDTTVPTGDRYKIHFSIGSF